MWVWLIIATLVTWRAFVDAQQKTTTIWSILNFSLLNADTFIHDHQARIMAKAEVTRHHDGTLQKPTTSTKLTYESGSIIFKLSISVVAK